MKLLGWMHRMLTFRQNNINETPSRDFSIGNSWSQPSLDDQKGSYIINGCYKLKGQRDNYLIRNNPFTAATSSLEEEEEAEAEAEVAITDLLFHGFLAIGTLGRTDDDPSAAASTPTFSISHDHHHVVDHIAEKESEATDNELRLINDELEKMIMSCDINVSSRRNSSSSSSHDHNNNIGRMSYCSTITLSGKPPLIETSAASASGIINTCTSCTPLQSYLFGIGPPQKQNIRRTSLGELFQKTKHLQDDKETHHDKSALLHVIKKMLKRRTTTTTTAHHASSKTTTSSGSGRRTTTLMDSSTPDQTKLQKILHMFNRKVHLDANSTSSCDKKTHKPTKIEIKNNNTHFVESTDHHEDIIIYPQPAISKQSRNNQSQLTDTTGNHEFWVKTDADYLVLEL